MVCSQVRELLLAPEASARAALAQHLASCPNCARTARALARLDERLRASLIVPLPPPAGGLAEDALAAARAEPAAANPAAARIDQALRASLVVEPPAELQVRLEALVHEKAADQAIKAAVLAEPPAELQARLAALVPAEQSEAWLGRVWNNLRARPGALAGQLAATAVLAYALLQLFAWLGSLPLILGDVPYALELLVLSPALDYLAQIEAPLQQLGVWLLVAGAGWLAVQALSRQPRLEP